MTKINSDLILQTATQLYAQYGFEPFSMRALAKQLKIAPSVLYHYFKNEDELLRSMFDYTNRQLGTLRSHLTNSKSAVKMFKDRIGFQIDQSEKIVAVLKYYLSYRHTFPKNKAGFVPDKSALHIEEVLTHGVQTGEFHVKNIDEDAKVITHAINGFLLEYYPHKPIGAERVALINRISDFLLRALTRT